jgi:hypothetical protein
VLLGQITKNKNTLSREKHEDNMLSGEIKASLGDKHKERKQESTDSSKTHKKKDGKK